MSDFTDTPLTGRLAPSPTGAQHLGNARTFLLAWLSARAQGGTVIFRLEDIDSPRVKPWAVRQALDDLRWLGLDWEFGPDIGGPHAPYTQTERLQLYSAALDQLKTAEMVYPCTCTRTDVEAAASAPHAGQEGPVYPGTCGGRSVGDARLLAGRPFCWRFRFRGAEAGRQGLLRALTLPAHRVGASSAVISFHDLICGSQTIDAEQLGDFVICKADGTPAYQLAVVVDDHAMGITEVVRGDDLLPSTFRQRALYDFFGWPSPTFAHVPLVVGPDGRRLAKRHGDTRISLLRGQGIPPERLIGKLAHTCGLVDRDEPIAARDLIPHFNWDRLPRQPLLWTPDDWKALTMTKKPGFS